MPTTIDLAALYRQVGEIARKHLPVCGYGCDINVDCEDGQSAPVVTYSAWVMAREPALTGYVASPEIALRKLLDALEDRQDPPPTREVGAVVVP